MPDVVQPRFASRSQDRLWEGFRRSLEREPKQLGPATPLNLIIAAHEWSLLAPLMLKEKADFKAIPQISVDPYIHQVNAAVAFFRRLSPRGLIADDVGLGKTITAGLIIRELLLRKKIERFLIIAPKLIVDQWGEELRSKFGLESTVLVGAELHRANRERNVITTYHSAARHMDDLIAAKFDLVVLDEIHKLRNLHTTGPQMARAIYAAQSQGVFRYALGLSATPLQNSLWDLYSIADILRTPQPNPYGDKRDFVSTYIADPPVGRKIRPGRRDDFKRRTSEYMHRTSRREAQLHFPDRVVGIESVVPSAEEAALQRETLELLFSANVPAFARISMAQTLLSSPKAVLSAIESSEARTSGVARLLLPLKDRFAGLTTNAKLERLLKLIKEYSGQDSNWRVIVFTIRRATAEFIREALVREGFGDVLAVIQGGQSAANAQAVADFVATPPRRRVLVSTDSGAEGVNLQACNVLYNFDLPWNPMVVEQRIGRIQRLGQKAEKVLVRNLVTRGSVEESVVARLFEKLQLYDATIGMAEEILGQLQDGDESIEELILALVQQALMRRDVEAMLREHEENARRAREELARQRDAMDAVMESTSNVGVPAMPDIRPTRPGMAMEAFWRLGMKVGGWSLATADGGRTLVADQPGKRSRRFTFEHNHPGRQQNVLGAPGVELVAEDERAFEEVVNEWKKVGLNFTSGSSLATADQLSSELAASLGKAQAKSTGGVLARRMASGRVKAILRANISVYHDQFEKLIESQAWPIADVELQAGAALPSALTSDPVAQVAVSEAKSAILLDPDIEAFERFYLARKAEEMERLDRARREDGVGPTMLARATAEIEERLTPVVETTLVAWAGDLDERAELRTSLVLADGVPVAVRLPVAGSLTVQEAVRAIAGDNPSVCHGGHLAPTLAVTVCVAPQCNRTSCPSCAGAVICKECEARSCAEHGTHCVACGSGICKQHEVQLFDGRIACAECSATCSESGDVALASELLACAPAGELVRPEHAVRSGVSGLWIQMKTASRSSISGAYALPSELEVCSTTGKYAMPSELVTLEERGERVLLECAERCAETGAWVRKGQLKACAVCGRHVVARVLTACEVTGQLAHPAEQERCAKSGKLVLPSQLEASAVSQKRVLPTLLAACAVSGKRALPEELAVCSLSGRLAMPELLVKIGTTGDQVLAEYAEACADTGEWVKRGELEPCSMCGRRVLPRLLVRCDVTGQLSHPTELTRCAESGKLVRPDQLGVSAVSQRRVLKSLMVPCSIGGERALPVEMVRSGVSGRLALPHRTGRCVLTGTVALLKELERSSVSGELALPEALLDCEVSGQRALPSEFKFCAITGKRTLPQFVGVSARSGRVALKEYLGTCAVSGRTLLKSEMVACAVTGRIADPERMERSAISGTPALPSVLAVSALSSRKVLPTELSTCSETGRLLAADEVVTCEFSGELVGIDRVTKSVASGKTGRKWKMDRSAVAPHHLAWPTEFIETVKGSKVLPNEANDCPACGKKARLASDDLGERYKCPSCSQIVCVLDKGSTTCSVCAAAFSASPASSAGVLLDQAFPKAKEWRVAHGAAFEVCIGMPSGWAVMTKPRLYVLQSGKVVYERELTKNM